MEHWFGLRRLSFKFLFVQGSVIFLGKPYRIATQIPTNKFRMMIRIDSFPSFVTSKAVFDTKRITAYGTEWFVTILLCKYCQTSNKYIDVNSSSPEQPEFFATFVYGTRSDGKECSFDVEATVKFKRPPTAKEFRFSHKFCFNLTTNFFGWGGCSTVSRIDVILALLFVVIFFYHKFSIFWTRARAI